jgi:hypothetical protein
MKFIDKEAYKFYWVIIPFNLYFSALPFSPEGIANTPFSIFEGALP